jgi:hypothetical protein
VELWNLQEQPTRRPTPLQKRIERSRHDRKLDLDARRCEGMRRALNATPIAIPSIEMGVTAVTYPVSDRLDNVATTCSAVDWTNHRRSRRAHFSERDPKKPRPRCPTEPANRKVSFSKRFVMLNSPAMGFEQRAWQVFWYLLQLLIVCAVIAGLYNVFADSAEVERMAMVTACEGQGPGCRAQMTRWERLPIGQTFDMATSRGSKIVKCHREYYLIGDYRCALREIEMPSAEPPMPPVSAKPPASAPAKPARAQPGARK